MNMKVGPSSKEGHRFRVLESIVLRKIFRPKRNKMTRTRKDCIMRIFMTCRRFLSKNHSHDQIDRKRRMHRGLSEGKSEGRTTWKK
jgi:hypothetical protein